MTDKWIRSSSRFIFKFGKSSSSATTRFHQSTSTTTHFGFQQIDENEKQKRVKTVFANVAHKYDLMNDAMSFGIHRLWKDYYVQKLRLTKDSRVLDVAGGTGDITFRIVDKLQRLPRGSATVTVADINEKMLDNGKIRASKLDSKAARDCINWITADAESLPFPDNSFDIYTIAFGIRNCTHIDKVLAEAFRVLKPGGTFSCLEFGPVNRPIFGKIYDFYSFQIIPVMGQIFVGDFNSYKYLVESIRLFPNQQKFSTMLKEAGFENVTYEELTGGICNIFMAKKPKIN